MRAGDVVYAALTASSALAALIGNRIYPDAALQDSVLPRVVYERTESVPTATIHDGVAVAVQVTISISAWASTRRQAEAVADAIEIALRSVAPMVNRFGHIDEQTGIRAEVTDFAVWEFAS